MAYMPSAMQNTPVPLNHSQQPPSGWRGLLQNQDLAMALLANSGYSPQKRSLGEILGTSMMQAQGMKSQREDDAFKRQYMQAQMAAMGGKQNRKLISVLGPEGKPVLKYEDEAAGMTPYAGGADSRPSAFIQAYDRYLQGGGKLGMMEFAKEFAASNAQYPYTVGTFAGEENLIPRTNPGAMATPPIRKLSTLAQEATAKTTLANAGAAGSEMGQSTAKAEFDLPRIEGNVATAKSDIQKLIAHPGRAFITGGTSIVPIIPGTPQADADALAKQIQGQTFLQAFNSLKGGGAITETEGTKAEAAIGRLQRAQSDEAYVESLKDLQGILDRGLEKARKQAGKDGSSAPKKRYNPETGRIE